MAIYVVAWIAIVAPLVGAGGSFFAETPRRAAQICRGFAVLSFLLTLVVLATRMKTATQAPYDSFLTFFTMSPPETSVFATRFETLLGVHIDSLTAVFAALMAFVSVALQSYAAAAMRGDTGYRRFFWTAALLQFSVLGLAYSPNLFQFWFMSVALSVSVYLLLLHWWDRPEAGVQARRVLVSLHGADIALLLLVAFVFIKLGVFASSQPAPAGQDLFDPFTFSGLQTLVTGVAHGSVGGAGLRTLEVAAILVLVVTLIRCLQVPFHVWLGDTVNAPVAVIALVVASTAMAGAYLLAREYPLVLASRHVLAAAAVIGGATVVLGGAVSMAQRDLYRAGAMVSAALLGVAVATLGAGGFGPGLFAFAAASLLTALFFMAAGNVSRAYRTRDLGELGAAWRRMRLTSAALAAWALGAGGLSLSLYYALAAAFDNAFPNGGHLGGATRAATIALLIAGALLVSASAGRIAVGVLMGEPARRRGFQLERVVEARDASRRWLGVLLAATIVVVLAGIPGIGPAQPTRAGSVAVFWNDFILYAGHAARPHVVFAALGVSLAALVAGLAAVSPSVVPTRVAALAEAARATRWWRALSRGLYLERAFHLAGRPFVMGGVMVARFDERIAGSLVSAVSDSVGLAADLMGAVRRARTALYLAGSAAFVCVIVVISLLAASGHLGGVTL